VTGVQPSEFDNKFQRAHLHLKLANIVTEIKRGRGDRGRRVEVHRERRADHSRA
jgi:hypothetical protein